MKKIITALHWRLSKIVTHDLIWRQNANSNTVWFFGAMPLKNVKCQEKLVEIQVGSIWQIRYVLFTDIKCWLFIMIWIIVIKIRSQAFQHNYRIISNNLWWLEMPPSWTKYNLWSVLNDKYFWWFVTNKFVRNISICSK